VIGDTYSLFFLIKKLTVYLGTKTPHKQIFLLEFQSNDTKQGWKPTPHPICRLQSPAVTQCHCTYRALWLYQPLSEPQTPIQKDSSQNNFTAVTSHKRSYQMSVSCSSFSVAIVVNSFFFLFAVFPFILLDLVAFRNKLPYNERWSDAATGRWQ
jgi:hypothetical protein